jgi:hypothetical protein
MSAKQRRLRILIFVHDSSEGRRVRTSSQPQLRPESVFVGRSLGFLLESRRSGVELDALDHLDALVGRVEADVDRLDEACIDRVESRLLFHFSPLLLGHRG